MLQMVDIEFIRKKHLLDGWSIRQVSRQLHLARQTVRKALASAEPPRYHLAKPRPCPAIDPRVNRAYGELARYYGCIIGPSRVACPQDKPRV